MLSLKYLFKGFNIFKGKINESLSAIYDCIYPPVLHLSLSKTLNNLPAK